MSRNIKYIFPVIFLIMLAAGGLLTVFTGYRHIGYSVLQDVRKEKPSVTPLVRISHIFRSIENAIGENFWEKGFFINCYGGIQKLQDKKIIEDVNPVYTVYRLSNNQLIFKPGMASPRKYAGNVVSFKRFLDEEGIPFLYVQAPNKYIRGYSSYPYHEEDAVNPFADEFAARLRSANVQVLDFRDLAVSSGLDKSKMFFFTDHHWTTGTAFWAFSEALKELNHTFDIGLDPFYADPRNYRVETHARCFLGSQGRRTGSAYSGLDDYDLIYPEFPAMFHMYIQQTGEHRNGLFNEVVINRDFLSSITRTYDCYWGMDYDRVVTENKQVGNGKKILVIKDSFGRPFSAFLSLAVSHMTMIDLRHYRSSVKEFIRGYRPDLVMIVYSAGKSEDSYDLFRFD